MRSNKNKEEVKVLDILFQVRATADFKGMGIDGFELTLYTNRELHGATLNVDNISRDFSVVRRFVRMIDQKTLDKFAEKVTEVKQALVGAKADNEEFNSVEDNRFQFTLYDEVFLYSIADEAAIDSKLIELFDTLDRIVNIKQFLRIEEGNIKSA